MKIQVLNLADLSDSSVDLDDVYFENIEGSKSVPVVIRWQLANRRLGTASVKYAKDVVGSTRKIVRQKGSGGARHGGKRAVQFVGGRTAFGPHPRDFGYTIPKKIVKRALSYVLRKKVLDGKVAFVEGMEKLEVGTNKLSKNLLSKGINRALVACGDEYTNFLLSLRNLYNYKSLDFSALNVYDIMNFDYLLVDKKLFDKFKEVL